MTRSRRLYFLLGLAVLLLCAAAAAPRARALWAQLPSGEWIEAADCVARREAPAPGRDALHVRAGMRPARGCTGTVVAELRRPRADGSWEVEASFRGGVRLDARLPGTPAEGCRLRVVFRAWRGSELMEPLSRELDFPYRRSGSLVVCMSESDRPRLNALYENGVKNGVKELEIVDAKRLHELEPNVSKHAVAALWAPTGGIVCPFNLTIALAENAFDNGVEFQFNTEVTGFTWEDGFWTIHTNHGDFESRYVINAAGVYADVLHNMVSTRKLHITPRRGDYCLLDKNTGDFVSHTIFQLPGRLGKGVLVSPTVHGNTIVGPTAIDIDDREGTNTTAEGLNDLIEKAGATVEHLPIRQTITSFAGLRAHEDHHEFVIGEAEGAQQFIDCAGIESPGLTSSPAIGLHVSELMRDLMGLREKAHFIATRRGVLDPKTLSKEDYQQLIREKPAYGQIICRCEQVTEGEILDAIHRPLGAKSLDGVKRRTRAGMGRCQAGFCSPRVMEILARELHVEQSEITKCGGQSRLITGTNKDSIGEVQAK